MLCNYKAKGKQSLWNGGFATLKLCSNDNVVDKLQRASTSECIWILNYSFSSFEKDFILLNIYIVPCSIDEINLLYHYLSANVYHLNGSCFKRLVHLRKLSMINLLAVRKKYHCVIKIMLRHSFSRGENYPVQRLTIYSFTVRFSCSIWR